MKSVPKTMQPAMSNCKRRWTTQTIPTQEMRTEYHGTRCASTPERKMRVPTTYQQEWCRLRSCSLCCPSSSWKRTACGTSSSFSCPWWAMAPPWWAIPAKTATRNSPFSNLVGVSSLSHLAGVSPFSPSAGVCPLLITWGNARFPYQCRVRQSAHASMVYPVLREVPLTIYLNKATGAPSAA